MQLFGYWGKLNLRVSLSRQRRKKMKKKRWLERWRLPRTRTPPSCLSKETVTFCFLTCVCDVFWSRVIPACLTLVLFPSRLSSQQHRQVPARLHQQGVRELRCGVSGRLVPLPTGKRKILLRVDRRSYGDEWKFMAVTLSHDCACLCQDYQFYIQNFTALQLGTVVPPSKQATFEYSFIPAEPMGGRPFGLVINLNYKDGSVRTGCCGVCVWCCRQRTAVCIMMKTIFDCGSWKWSAVKPGSLLLYSSQHCSRT